MQKKSNNFKKRIRIIVDWFLKWVEKYLMTKPDPDVVLIHQYSDLSDCLRAALPNAEYAFVKQHCKLTSISANGNCVAIAHFDKGLRINQLPFRRFVYSSLKSNLNINLLIVVDPDGTCCLHDDGEKIQLNEFTFL